jgi:hypothetical protein
MAMLSRTEQIRGDTLAFARLNEWSRTKIEFTLRQLAGMKRSKEDRMPVYMYRGDDPHWVLDHCHYFKAEGKAVAIVTMPHNAQMEHAREIADRYGLDVLAPPIAKSGWWLPGSTFCFAFVRPGTTVKWLPQQRSYPDGEAQNA